MRITKIAVPRTISTILVYTGLCSLKEVTQMPFWLTWFFIGALFTGGAAALHNATPPRNNGGP
jgi:hypothetical protein